MRKRTQLLALTLAFLLLFAPAQAITTEQTLELLEQYYVDEVPAAAYEAQTVADVVAALGDVYTEYYSAEEYQEFLSSMEDTSLVGIGAVGEAHEDGLLVAQVLEGSPAQAGGLQAGDIIIAVEGKEVAGQSLDEIVAQIRGEEGTKVSVTFRRGNRRRTVSLTRAPVVVPSTTGTLLEGGVGYIDCDTFGSTTLAHFQDIMEQLDPDVGCWLIDLRGNLGGLSTAAADAAGLFLGKETVVTFLDGQGNVSVTRSTVEQITDKPAVVLVDGHTASAAEIFAAAMQNYRRGMVVGERTYGKGVAQTVLDRDTHPDYFTSGDALKVTFARFYSPIWDTTDQIGVIPDLLVPNAAAYNVGVLLAETPAPEAETLLTVSWPRLGEEGYFQIVMDRAAQEEWKPVYEALLAAVPEHLSLFLGDLEVDREGLARAFGLTLPESSFPDVADSIDPQALNTLRTYELVKGSETGEFLPDNHLSRAELCQMLAEALNCVVPNNPSPFPDVAEDAWYADAVTAMSNRGLVKGGDDGLFHPEDQVDHQQLMTVLGRLAAWLNADLAYVSEDILAYVSEEMAEELDYGALDGYDSWAKPSVWLLSGALKTDQGEPLNFLWDDPQAISPTAAATRDEAGQLFYNLLYYLDYLP